VLTGLIADLVTAAGGVFTSSTFGLSAGGGNIFEYILSAGEKAKADAVTFS